MRSPLSPALPKRQIEANPSFWTRRSMAGGAANRLHGPGYRSPGALPGVRLLPCPGRVVFTWLVCCCLLAAPVERAAGSPSTVASPVGDSGGETGAPAPRDGEPPPDARSGEASSGAAAAGEPPVGAKEPEDPVATTPKEVTSAPRPKPTLSHRLQVSVDVAVGVGYSLAVTYRDTTWCGDRDGGDNESFCSGMNPVFMDFGLAFGVLDWLDILAEFRLGLMDDLVGNRPLVLMPGVRFWVDAHSSFKYGVALQLVLDLTAQDSADQEYYGPPVSGETIDLGGRVYAQFQYDFLRYVGIFGRLGAIITARRWMAFHLSAQIGMQARFP